MIVGQHGLDAAQRTPGAAFLRRAARNKVGRYATIPAHFASVDSLLLVLMGRF